MNLTEAWGKTLDFLRGRKRDYQVTFLGSPHGERVLADLAQFCRAHETCFSPDQKVQDAREGRREVWLRIQDHLNLSSEQLATLYRAKVPTGE